ncbi:MAG: DUF1499 domain-containing protein [Calditrichaeota bacterium]|nr:DUF1499 domain-containing protein [Calditrichota bacterium]MCB9365754.1 DUF1499 domain-containing protein [Calditrichota bacterium]
MPNPHRLLTTFALLAVLFLALGIGARLSVNALSPVPSKLGVSYGRLRPCPQFPNCVNSQATDPEHKIEPLRFPNADRRVAYSILSDVLKEMPRAELLVSRVDYVHAEFRSLVWGFRDDTEFWLIDSTHTIEVRSASRLGKGDFGVNRKRVEDIRARFNKKLSETLKG